MDNILSIALAISIGLSIYKKYRKYHKKHMEQLKTTRQRLEQQSQKTLVIDKNRQQKHLQWEESEATTPDANTMPQKTEYATENITPSDSQEITKYSEFSQDFDLYKAVVYSEILKSKFEEE